MVQVALLSMNATAVGLDFSAATTVVFAEVPDTADVLLQAEGRAHRLTSRAAVNVYVLLCKRSRDTASWCRLADSLEKQAPLLLGAGARPGAPLQPRRCLCPLNRRTCVALSTRHAGRRA